MATLYRQYRPQRFSDLAGQEHVREALVAAVVKDKLAHAYLFHGPRGVGKTTSARLLAKSVNCRQPAAGEPCNECPSCLAVIKGNHPDILEIDAASNRGIDDVRALREAAKFVPALGRRKVYIIDEVHMLTNEAASALLKTLEEPSGQVMFILATTEMHKVLPTIASRCQVYRFRRATAAELRARLAHLLQQEGREADDDVLLFIIERADGCYRDAESLLGQLLTWHDGRLNREQLEALGLPPRQLLERFLQALAAGESAPALAAIDEAFAAGIDPEQFLQEAVRLARDGAVHLAQEAGADTTGLHAWTKQAPQLAERAPVIIRALLQALQDLAYVPEPLIALHLAILTVCTKKGAEPVAPAAAAPKVTDDKALEQLRGLWPELIDAVKQQNPVASTFLRALEPAAFADGTITVKAHYSLHRTFFDKAANKQLLAAALKKVLDQEVSVTVILEEAGQKTDEKFIETVKEVFG